MAGRKTAGIVALVWGLMAGGGAAQTAPAALHLGEAVTTAWAHYPGVAAAEQAAQAARAQTEVARTAFLPNAGVVAQWDRATDNATLGLSFGTPLPGISGTVPRSDYSPRSAWTSAAGLYFSWEIADFGRRAANLRYYLDLGQQARDQAEVIKLQVGAHAADAFLNLAAARQQTRVAQADVARWQGLAAIVEALVDQQLRPGADGSRAQAELAAARIRASAAVRDGAAAEAALREALGLGAQAPLPALAALPHTPVAPVAPAAVPPQLRVQADAVAAAQSHQQEIARSALPRTYALGSAYGRGSGVLAAGQLAPGAAGLAPATAGNWALGVGVDFSITGWHANRAARAQAAAQFAQQQARQKQVAAALAAAQQKAAADWTAAQTVAQESPIGLAAARAGEAQARVRYQTGLASLVELANAEQLLAQADSDDALSRLQVWRALIETAFVAGSLQPLLQAAGAH